MGDPKGAQDQREEQGLQGHEEREVQLVNQVKLDLQELLELLVRQEMLAILATEDFRESLEPLGLEVTTDDPVA